MVPVGGADLRVHPDGEQRLAGFWIQPRGLMVGQRLATPVVLPAISPDSVEQWVEEGSLDANQRGLIRARQLLEEYEKPYLDPAIDEALKDFKTRRLSEIVGEVR